MATLLIGALPRTALAQAAGGGQAATDAAVANAERFFSTLDEARRAAVVFPFDDEEQRRRWSNLPTPMVRRKGLRLGDLTPAQLAAAHEVLKSLLSPAGYQKVLGIMEGDEILRGEGGPPGLQFGKDEYYISFVGGPSATRPWTLQWGGHHLALNITVAGDRGVLTPSHTAAQPATYTKNGKTVRPLGGEYDKAIDLLESLTPEQRKKAVIGSRMADLVLGPGQDGKTIEPEGLPGSAMTDAQRAQLAALAGEWIGMIHETAAATKLAEVKAHLAETWFAWSGPTTRGSPAYYRIQGPTLFIEFSPQRLGGDPMNHIHTMFRDPTNDYGRSWWKK